VCTYCARCPSNIATCVRHRVNILRSLLLQVVQSSSVYALKRRGLQADKHCSLYRLYADSISLFACCR
jgi:hypothetical protein